MRRTLGRVLRVVLLLALGVSIGGPALDPEFEPPHQHFDGDADDAGHVGKVFAHWVEAAVTDTLTFLPSAPKWRRAPSDTPGRSSSLTSLSALALPPSSRAFLPTLNCPPPGLLRSDGPGRRRPPAKALGAALRLMAGPRPVAGAPGVVP